MLSVVLIFDIANVSQLLFLRYPCGWKAHQTVGSPQLYKASSLCGQLLVSHVIFQLDFSFWVGAYGFNFKLQYRQTVQICQRV